MSMKVVDFEFQNQKVRSVVIGGDVWFVARDVFGRLETKWDSRKLDSIPDSWKSQREIPLAVRGSQNSQTQKTWLINEQAFYRIVYASNHPDAIEFTNKAAQFMKDLREGKIGPEELGAMRESVQQLYFDFVGVIKQRKVNHKRNNTKGMPLPAGRYWRGLYQDLTGVSFECKMEQLRRQGVADSVLRNSGQDGLRSVIDEYGYAIAFATISKLTTAGYNRDEVVSLVKDGVPFLKRLGRLVGKNECLPINRQVRRSNEPNPDQLGLAL